MMFTCPRCGGMYFQAAPHRDALRAIEMAADRRIDAGDENAVAWSQDQIKRVVRERGMG